MLLNSIRPAFRSVHRRRGQTLISVAGLAAGLLGCLLIFIWVRGELSYDRFHENADRTRRVAVDQSNQTPCALAAFLEETYTEVERAVRVHPRWWNISREQSAHQARINCVDPSVFDVFSWEFVRGNPDEAIASPHSIVMTESLAGRVFGDTDPMGQTVMIEKTLPMTVTGIIRDVPFNSHFDFEALTNLATMRELFSWYPPDDSWTDGDVYTYVLLHDGASRLQFQGKIQAFADSRFPEADISVDLQPITDIHLRYAGSGATGITYVYIFVGAALLILLSACVNYINLATARANDRAREVGVRKVIGAGRTNLVAQFMAETVIVALIAAAIALGLAELLRPQFSGLVGREVSFDLLGDPIIVAGTLAIVVITGLVAGLYPSIVLASFRPVTALRWSGSEKARGSTLRRLLVIAQFALSVFLISGVAVVATQLDYVRNKDLGYDREGILSLPLGADIWQHLGAIFNDLDNNPHVVSYTGLNTLLDRAETTTDGVSWEGQADGQKMTVRVLSVGYNFPHVFRIPMVAGRFFSEEHPSDREQGYVLNETAVSQLGWKDPIGKRFAYGERKGTVIGVVKDFNFRSLHHEIQPLVMATFPWTDNLAIRVASDNLAATAADIQTIVKKYVPDYPLQIGFFEEELASHYRGEQRTAQLLGIASGLAILMSCLGLLGLVSHAVRRRTKEIGVRKVLGATISNITGLISREFAVTVGIACLIAWPAAYWAASQWLHNFAFTAPISWWLLAVSGVITLAAAVATAGFHTLRAARANPVEALRYE